MDTAAAQSYIDKRELAKTFLPLANYLIATFFNGTPVVSRSCDAKSNLSTMHTWQPVQLTFTLLQNTHTHTRRPFNIPGPVCHDML